MLSVGVGDVDHSFQFSSILCPLSSKEVNLSLFVPQTFKCPLLDFIWIFNLLLTDATTGLYCKCTYHLSWLSCSLSSMYATTTLFLILSFLSYSSCLSTHLFLCSNFCDPYFLDALFLHDPTFTTI